MTGVTVAPAGPLSPTYTASTLADSLLTSTSSSTSSLASTLTVTASCGTTGEKASKGGAFAGFVRRSLKAFKRIGRGCSGSSAEVSDSCSVDLGSVCSSRPSGFRRSEDGAVLSVPDAWNVVNFQELDLGKAVGEGSFGQVFLAKYYRAIVAVKMLTPQKVFEVGDDGQQADTIEQLAREVGIMSTLRHPNIIQYLGVCLEPPSLVMEYCSRRSVDAVLAAALADNSKVSQQLSWARLLGMACDAARGMLYLHSRSIVHRDLKSANLLVDSSWHVKIADFNLSKAVEPSMFTSSICLTNPRWLAPEVLLGEQASFASDIWAFGTVLWELMTWETPFKDLNSFQVILAVSSAKVGSGLAIPKPEDLPAGPLSCYIDYVELMQSCWERDPSVRPSMECVASRLAAMLCAEQRRHSMCGSVAAPSTPRPWSARHSVEWPAPSPLGGAPRRASSVDSSAACTASGVMGSAFYKPGDAESLEGASRRNAAQELQAMWQAGYMAVDQAGHSLDESNCKEYPFVNPGGYFMCLRAELEE